MDAVIQDQYQALEEPEQDPFKSQLSSFCKLYLFLAQIIPYQDCDLEKLYAYGRCLLKKLPHPDQDTIVDISNLIELKCYRLEEVSRGSIDLNTGEAQPLRGPTDVGTRQADQETPLSHLIEALNERFGTDFTLADQLFFEQITATAIANDNLKQAAKVNTRENFAPVLEKHLEALFLERIEGNEKIFMQMMNDPEFRALVFEKLLISIYENLHNHDKPTDA